MLNYPLIESELTLETDVKVEPVVYKENSLADDWIESAKAQRAYIRDLVLEDSYFSNRG